MAHFGVRCVFFLPYIHVLIVTYHAPTPEAVDAGPLLSGRVSQVSTMTLDALIPRIGDVPLESAVQRACNMAFTFARHVEAHERGGSFVSPAALVCVGWKQCSTSWILC